MSESMNRRQSVKKSALAALALSLGIPEQLLADPDSEATRFQLKFYAGERLLETLDVEEATRYLDARPTALQVKWYDGKVDRREPLSTLGFTESRQLKIG